MPRTSIDLDELERGTGASRAPSVEQHGTRTAETVQNGDGSNLEASASRITPDAAVEDEVDPGE